MSEMRARRPELLALLAAILLLSGCSAAASHNEPAAKSNVEKKQTNPLQIKLTPDLRDQVKIGTPSLATVAETLRVPGRVEADATRLARIGSPVTGRITDLLVMEGERVRPGQVLATLYSTELSSSQFAFIKAFSQQQLSERAASRARQLLSADVIGNAELQRREAEVLQATAEVSALRQQLKVLGMTDESIQQLEKSRKLNSEYQVIASIGGTVLERKVTIGQIVQPAEEAFLVADLSSVWLTADIPERDAGEIRVGETVEAEIPALGSETVRGRLTFVSATVNPDTRTVHARMNLLNPQGRYKPAMLATMVLKDRSHKATVVPLSAIVREGNADHVFVETAPDTFTLRQITLGDEDGDRRVVSEGVSVDDKIVLDGAFHLNNERKRLALQGGGA